MIDGSDRNPSATDPLPATQVDQAPHHRRTSTGLSDTSPEAEAVMLRLLRAMTPAERLARMGELNRLVRNLAMADLMHRYPHDSEAELRVRLAARLYGPELAGRAYGVSDPEKLRG